MLSRMKLLDPLLAVTSTTRLVHATTVTNDEPSKQDLSAMVARHEQNGPVNTGARAWTQVDSLTLP